MSEKTMRQKIDELVDELELEDIIMFDEFDSAIIGLFQQFNTYFVAYDREKCIEILTVDGMTYEEANEYFEFNVIGGYLGKSTPAFLINIEND